MSLRLRLTLLYSSLLGVILLIFGTLVYSLVSFNLMRQIDASLQDASRELISNLVVDPNGNFQLSSLPSMAEGENFFFQVWDSNNKLQISKPASLLIPLDSTSLPVSTVIYHTTLINGVPLRVINVPIRSILGPNASLQVAINMTLMDLTRSSLSFILITLTFITMLLTGLASWFVTGRALAPLQDVTEVATQITQADDLSRRIPIKGDPEDEIGQVIHAFNDTLTRLEKLFGSQQRFVADVSHELRTPLTVIKGNVSLMRKVRKVDLESLTSIDQEVDRLTRLVGDLLLLAQAESRRLPLDMKPLQLDKILLEVFQQLRTLAGDHMKVHIHEIDQVEVIGDSDRLKQVFLNLGGNAIQYTPAGGEVNLTLRKTEKNAMISFADNGPGIKPDDLPHIFERFYRSDTSRKRGKEDSFGLGLSIAFWIVRNHGGSIEVETKMGSGSTFTVSLPLPNAINLAEITTPEKNPNAQSLKTKKR
jgi:two-component system, OmpR family, sensor kinase